MSKSERERLKQQYDYLSEEWQLRYDKLKRLRSAIVIETSPVTKFQLEKQIRSEEVDLNALEQQLIDLEQQIDSENAEKGNQESGTGQVAEEAEFQEKAPINVFCSYSREDLTLYDRLEAHLAILKRQGIINTWSDQQTEPGTDWQESIFNQLRKAQIILLLVSADYLASDYLYTEEMKYVFRRHRAKELTIIPIILRPVDWSTAPFSSLQVLPRDGRPITLWEDIDQAFAEIAQAIRQIVKQSNAIQEVHAPSIYIPTVEQSDAGQEELASDVQRAILSPKKTYFLYEVFKDSGVPKITFVEPPNFYRLKLALAHPGRGVVIEGPSGIGKTTALKEALSQLEMAGRNSGVEILSARIPERVERLKNIDQWQKGIVAIDDFHLLDRDMGDNLANRLKYLADQESAKKIVIVGIPHTRTRLIDVGHDIATRIEVIAMGKTSDIFVEQMIQKGELALNISFLRKAEIVSVANGSLNIAQIFCKNLAARENVEQTQGEFKAINCDLEEELKRIREEVMKEKYGKFVQTFCLLDGRRNQNYITLIFELARCEEAYISLAHAKTNYPHLQAVIEDFEVKEYINKLEKECPKYQDFIFYDKYELALVIDDPQLIFYLRQSSLSSLRKAIGMSESGVRDQVFISYSRSDSVWLEKLQVYLRPLERKGLINRWDDTKIKAGTKWREEIKKALDSAKIAVLLVSSNFLASDFIEEEELPPLLKAAKEEGALIFSVILNPCETAFDMSELKDFQTVNPPDDPISGMEENKWRKTFDKLSKEIVEALDLKSK